MPEYTFVDVMEVLADMGYTGALITEGEASRVAAKFGFVRLPTNNPRRAVPLTDLADDIARRMNAVKR